MNAYVTMNLLLVEFLVLVVGAFLGEGFVIAVSISAGIFVYFHYILRES